MKITRTAASLVRALLIPVALSGVAAGCGITVEAEVPEVEVTHRDLSFTGIPLEDLLGVTGDYSTIETFSQEHDALELPAGIDPEVKALGVTIKAKSGIRDFGFLHLMRITMSDGQHEPVELLAYEQDPSAPVSDTLTLKSANPANLFDQWKTDSATFNVEVAGKLPSDAWTVDLTVRFSGKIRYEY